MYCTLNIYIDNFLFEVVFLKFSLFLFFAFTLLFFYFSITFIKVKDIWFCFFCFFLQFSFYLNSIYIQLEYVINCLLVSSLSFIPSISFFFCF